MLFGCSVDTPIHVNRFNLLALRLRIQCRSAFTKHPLRIAPKGVASVPQMTPEIPRYFCFWLFVFLSEELNFTQISNIQGPKNTYQKKKAPGNDSVEPRVDLDVKILGLLDVSEKQKRFTVKLLLTFRWTDDRLQVQSIPPEASIGPIRHSTQRELFWDFFCLRNAKKTHCAIWINWQWKPFWFMPVALLVAPKQQVGHA